MKIDYIVFEYIQWDFPFIQKSKVVRIDRKCHVGVLNINISNFDKCILKINLPTSLP